MLKIIRHWLLGLLCLLCFGVAGSSARAEFDGDARAVEAAKKFAGTTLNFVFPAGLGALDGKQFSGPLWEKLTGIKVNVIEVPTNDIFTRILQEHRAKTGAYDVVSVIPSWVGDLVAAGAIEDLDPYIEKYGYRSEIADIEPAYRNTMQWNNHTYTLADDGDVFLMYYRRDLFADPGTRRAFQDRFKRELAPPKTWAEFDEIARFFTETRSPQLYGTAMQRNPGQLHYYFQERFRNEGGRFFEPTTMKATINNETGIRVLREMMDETKLMPPGAAAWGPMEVMKEYLSGNLAMTVWWPPLGRWAEGFGKDQAAMSWVPESKIAGRTAYAPMPGGHPELALGGATALSPNSRNKEAAYLFMQWSNSARISAQRVRLPYSLRDPFRASHFADPAYRALWPAAGEYLDALSVGARDGLYDLSIRNTFKYTDALIRGLQKAIAGSEPKQVLDEVAAEWDRVTQQGGVEQARASYEAWSANPAAYPK